MGQAGISPEDVGLVELNEVLAAQSPAMLYEWGMDAKDEKLNPNGVAIALGICSDAPRLASLPRVRYELATMRMGIGQGTVMVVKKSA
jgi:acetyl-CoA C-acetyltransferase